MPTVPNWIAKAVVYQSRDRGLRSEVLDILSWRPTRTQVVVTVQTARGHTERRFRLAGLTEIVGGRSSALPASLIPRDDPRVLKARRSQQVRTTIDDLRAALLDEQLDPSMDVEELLAAADRIQRAATKAVAELGELL